MKKIKDLTNATWKNHQIEEVQSLGNIKGGKDIFDTYATTYRRRADGTLERDANPDNWEGPPNPDDPTG